MDIQKEITLFIAFLENEFPITVADLKSQGIDLLRYFHTEWETWQAAKAVPEWISLNAKEPPLGTMVLICWSDAPDVEPEKDYMDHDVDHGVNYWANYNDGDEPSHWMPLPHPTQEQAHD